MGLTEKYSFRYKQYCIYFHIRYIRSQEIKMIFVLNRSKTVTSIRLTKYLHTLYTSLPQLHTKEVTDDIPRKLHLPTNSSSNPGSTMINKHTSWELDATQTKQRDRKHQIQSGILRRTTWQLFVIHKTRTTSYKKYIGGIASDCGRCDKLRGCLKKNIG